MSATAAAKTHFLAVLGSTGRRGGRALYIITLAPLPQAERKAPGMGPELTQRRETISSFLVLLRRDTIHTKDISYVASNSSKRRCSQKASLMQTAGNTLPLDGVGCGSQPDREHDAPNL